MQDSRRKFWIPIALVVLLAAAAVPATTQTTTTVTLAVIGDFGISMDTERNIDRAYAGGARGLIGLGDYNYDGSLRGWFATVGPVTEQGVYFARGNHDDLNAFKTSMPGQTPTWSTVVNGVRIIGIDTEQRLDSGTTQYNWLVAELQKEPASAGKIVVMHKPWWLGAGAVHPGSEFPGSGSTMDTLMSRHGVDIVYAGHEHNYQRTARNNIPYVIAGTGGRSIYAVAGADPGTVKSCACYGHVLLTISGTSMQSKFVNIDGTQIDSFTATFSSTAFTATFTPKQVGNPNWVEVDVDSAQTVAKVYAKINGGAWYLLTKQTSGNWGRALAAPDGSSVQFRAFNSAGAYVTSSVYTWSAPFSASFTPQAVGNDNWVEVAVTSTDPIDRVYAKINGGPWYLLTKQTWGNWARELSAPNGSTVQFRAFNTAGEYTTSSTYTWT